MKFINELGNEIKINISFAKEGIIDFVNIVIEGPKSTSTNVLTLQEARVLRDILEGEL